jgi:hypothetical protein
VVRRLLLCKHGLGGAYEYMRRHLHKKLYAKQVIKLNKGARDVDRPYLDTSRPHLLPIAMPPGLPKVPKMETGREAIFWGVRRGFTRAYDTLVEDPGQRERYRNCGTCVPQQYSELRPPDLHLADGICLQDISQKQSKEEGRLIWTLPI